MKKCIGCGATLQSTNKEEFGYIPKDKINNSEYCERCFKLIHYNERIVTKLDINNNDIIETINKESDLTYFLIDFLNISKETLDTFHKITSNKVLVISKTDIIPKSIKQTKITDYLTKEYNIKDKIIYQSTKSNINTKSLIENIDSNKKTNIYVVGYTNSGKSTFINKLKWIYLKDDKKIATSSVPNTTINFIYTELKENLNLIDSPGFMYEDTVYDKDNFDLIRNISPRNTLKPVTIQTKENTIIDINGLIEISCPIKNSLTFYMSSNLNITKKYSSTLKIEETITKVEDDTDLIIKTLGFINIKKQCNLKIKIKNKELIETRTSIFRG